LGDHHPLRIAAMANQETELSQHQALALWAASCAERVLDLFEAENLGDDRPRQAIEAVMKWQRGELGVNEARRLAFASHAAARQAVGAAAVAAARAAGHAAATVHVPTHAPHAASYARAAKHAVGQDAEGERRWQVEEHTKLIGETTAADDQ
jgi:hypothetical protein